MAAVAVQNVQRYHDERAGFHPSHRCSVDGVSVHYALRQPNTAAKMATPASSRKPIPPLERTVSFHADCPPAEEVESDPVFENPSPKLERKKRSNTWSGIASRRFSLKPRNRSYSEADASKQKLDPSVYDCSPKRNRNERVIMASWALLWPFYVTYLAFHEFPVDEEDKLNDALISGWYRLYMRQRSKWQNRETS